jgi:hypothetical protein
LILRKKNLPIAVTNEELAYGLGFLMDVGKHNTGWLNNREKPSFNKTYKGYQATMDSFYLEDKKFGGRISNADFIGYSIKNVSQSHIQLSWILKTHSIIALIFFVLIFLGLIVVANAANSDAQFIILAWSIVLPIMLLIQCIKSLIFYKTLINDLKKTIPTRVKLREYHRTR